MRVPVTLLAVLAGAAIALGATFLSLRGAIVVRDCVPGGTGYDPDTAEVYKGFDCEGGIAVLIPTGTVAPKRLVPGNELGV